MFETRVSGVSRSVLIASFVLAISLVAPVTAGSAAPRPGGVEVSPAVHSDVSPPLRDIAPRAPIGTRKDKPLRLPHAPSAGGTDTAVQTAATTAVATTTGLNFAGVGNGDYGFAPNAAPPDTNGAVGLTQYVQWVNLSFAVFDKTTGARLYGPAAGNTLWAGFGGGCETNNDGDPIAQYDKLAGRWVMTQLSYTTLPYMQCVAVSTTSDATGTYSRYAFSYTGLNDYPKVGVWPDAYYISFNIFNNGQTFAGAKACAYDRTAMLAGAPATQQCFQLSTSYASLLPADVDGPASPPAIGEPEFFLNFGSNSLNLWKFHVDWLNTANTTLSGPTNIPVASFFQACGSCLAQPGTNNGLDSLGDRLMYRLAYRNFADHESLVVNHTVNIGVVGKKSLRHMVTGVRWYELRAPNGTPLVYQQSTYSPDSSERWMGSIAMDKIGDILVGYSVSSPTVFPAIRYTGRLPSDPLGTLEAEASIVEGSGSQISGLSRWGDYSAMSVDPVDDCTFYFTSEYLKATGSFNWSTRIASFKFPACQ